jgi:malate dehydrogenase (quinone)
MQRFYPETFARYEKSLTKLIPAYGKKLNSDPALAKKVLASTAKTLKLKA